VIVQLKETKMTIPKIAALPTVMLAAGLAGCSLSNFDKSPYVDQTSSAGYGPPDANYRANTSLGSVMTTPRGMTVYTFDRDQNGRSNCYADCARQWPPVIADGHAQKHGRMSLVSRTDGRQQWAYDGRPLYTYSEDSMHGDVNGDNVGSVWHVVR
jgi:predicted lipoprotein with Yx(FWY)xxD motif